MESMEARAALEAVDEVEARAGGKRRVPWGWMAVLSAGFGASLALVYQDSWWGFIPLLISLAGLLILERSLYRETRASLKQDPRSKHSSSWAALLSPFVTIIVMMLVPRGNLSVSIILGIVVAVALFGGLAYERR